MHYLQCNSTTNHKQKKQDFRGGACNRDAFLYPTGLLIELARSCFDSVFSYGSVEVLRAQG